LKFLLVLKDPCHELADAKPSEIPKQLPKIISIIRVIWTNSEYYNTGDRLTAMFRKVEKNIIIIFNSVQKRFKNISIII